jgi:ABC-type transport system involved in cytochrome c biogenesis permease subunit
MAIHLSLRVAPPDLQQGGNSRISYVHVPAARMSIVIYIATAINSSLFPLTKHPLFLRSSGTGTEIGAFSTLFTSLAYQSSKHRKSNFGNLTKQATD